MYQINNFILFLVILSCAGYGISDVSNTESMDKELMNSTGATNDRVPMGNAYQSKSDYFLGLQTVMGEEVEHLGNTNIDFRVGVDLGYEQVLKLIDGKVDAGFKIPVVRVDAGASYAKKISADRYTGTYTVYSSVKPKSKILMPATDAGYEPTDAALELAHKYPGNKSGRLGDSFVLGYAYGSNAVINMKIDYRNESDKRNIGGYLSVDWLGKVKVDGDLSILDDEKKQSVKITVSGYQSGGNPNSLLNIIPAGIMECTLLNPGPCFKLFEEAVNYLKDDYIHQFDDFSKYNITETYIAEYAKSGPGLRVLVPDGGYEDNNYLTSLIIKELTSRWVDERLVYRRAQNLQRYYASEFSFEELEKIKEIESSSRNNANLFGDIISYCKANLQGDFCSEREKTNLVDHYADYSSIIDVLE